MKISRSDLVDLSRALFEARHKVMAEKGKAYSSTDDCLKNFDDAARMLGVAPEVIWAVYAHKHFSSIMTFCSNPDAPISEGIDSRIVDMMNYLDLLHAMITRRPHA